MTLIRPRPCILRNTVAIPILVLAIGHTGIASVRALISSQTASYFVVVCRRSSDPSAKGGRSTQSGGPIPAEAAGALCPCARRRCSWSEARARPGCVTPRSA
jgi:hypothetical protein